MSEHSLQAHKGAHPEQRGEGEANGGASQAKLYRVLDALTLLVVVGCVGGIAATLSGFQKVAGSLTEAPDPGNVTATTEAYLNSTREQQAAYTLWIYVDNMFAFVYAMLWGSLIRYGTVLTHLRPVFFYFTIPLQVVLDVIENSSQLGMLLEVQTTGAVQASTLAMFAAASPIKWVFAGVNIVFVLVSVGSAVAALAGVERCQRRT